MKHANVWPWGACWLQDEACQRGLEHLDGCLALGCLLGCQMKHANCGLGRAWLAAKA